MKTVEENSIVKTYKTIQFDSLNYKIAKEHMEVRQRFLEEEAAGKT